MLSNNSLSSTARALPAPIKSIPLSGTAVTPYTHVVCTPDTFGAIYANIQSSLMTFGSGDTPAAVTDCSLKAPFSTTTEVGSETSATVEFKNNKTVITVSGVATNLASSPVNVKEIAWMRVMPLTNTESATSASKSPVLMARHVLSEPVTLAHGEKHTFEMKIVI